MILQIYKNSLGNFKAALGPTKHDDGLPADLLEKCRAAALNAVKNEITKFEHNLQ